MSQRNNSRESVAECGRATDEHRLLTSEAFAARVGRDVRTVRRWAARRATSAGCVRLRRDGRVIGWHWPTWLASQVQAGQETGDRGQESGGRRQGTERRGHD